MSLKSLLSFVAEQTSLPMPVDTVLNWIRENTDHKDITLCAVQRSNLGFRGICRRRVINTSLTPYKSDIDAIEIRTQIIYGEDLSQEWKRLVIIKELLHIFDPIHTRVNSREGVGRLIPSIILDEVSTYWPAIHDQMGVFWALAVLIPRPLRLRLATAIQDERRSIEEVAALVRLPVHFVDIWLRCGDQIDKHILS